MHLAEYLMNGTFSKILPNHNYSLWRLVKASLSSVTLRTCYVRVIMVAVGSVIQPSQAKVLLTFL